MQIINSKHYGQIRYTIGHTGENDEIGCETFRVTISDNREGCSDNFFMELLYNREKGSIFAFRCVPVEEILEELACSDCGGLTMDEDDINSDKEKGEMYFGLLEHELKTCAEFILRML